MLISHILDSDYRSRRSACWAEDRWPEDKLAIEPHPLLSAYYADRGDRVAFVRALFDRTAGDYDRINNWFSFGSGDAYRRGVLARAGLGPGQRVLDVATGTGLVARAVARLQQGQGWILGLDLSAGMLAVARQRLPLDVVQGRAEALPLPDQSFDALTMGYALRHVADLATTFGEFKRVLVPGGRIVLLEIGRPSGRFAYRVARFYLGAVIPALARLASGRDGAALMRYYWDTIDQCVAPSVILEALHEAGFEDVECRTTMGMFRNYLARRPC
ncbi:MAG: dimethylmenaquinone methyltransferase [Rhodospirillales bacterium]|nr:dimethylmenaquinone methyltransferase [Rhodospirillales bacterium]